LKLDLDSVKREKQEPSSFSNAVGVGKKKNSILKGLNGMNGVGGNGGRGGGGQP
jgi:hypothetical protein